MMLARVFLQNARDYVLRHRRSHSLMVIHQYPTSIMVMVVEDPTRCIVSNEAIATALDHKVCDRTRGRVPLCHLRIRP